MNTNATNECFGRTLVGALLETLDRFWQTADLSMLSLSQAMRAWDGRLVSLNEKALPGALMQLVFSEWLPLIR
jgi:hypothetical protein